MTTDRVDTAWGAVARQHVEQADTHAALAQRAVARRRREADSIRDALVDARDGLERARVGLRVLAAMERDEAREAEA